MKKRKKTTILKVEARNALYHKTMVHNIELASKNTELSQTVDRLRNAINKANKRVWWKPWTYLNKPILVE